MTCTRESQALDCALACQHASVGLGKMSADALPPVTALLVCCPLQTHTPVYLSWIKKISYVAYGYSGLVKNEFAGLQIFTAQGMQVRLSLGKLHACGSRPPAGMRQRPFPEQAQHASMSWYVHRVA